MWKLQASFMCVTSGQRECVWILIKQPRIQGLTVFEPVLLAFISLEFFLFPSSRPVVLSLDTAQHWGGWKCQDGSVAVGVSCYWWRSLQRGAPLPGVGLVCESALTRIGGCSVFCSHGLLRVIQSICWKFRKLHELLDCSLLVCVSLLCFYLNEFYVFVSI